MYALLAVLMAVAAAESNPEASVSISEGAVPAPGPARGQLVVQLHRQRVPVKGPGGDISYKSVYFGSVYLGSPVPQEFSVVYDTGSGHVIVPSESCKSTACLTHRRYKRKLSVDAKDIDYDGTVVVPGGDRDQITIAFGTGEVTGEFVQDGLCLGTVSRVANAGGTMAEDCVNLRVVAATEMTDDPFQAFAFDGVLGLSLAALALAPEFSLFGQMVAQGIVAEPSFGVFLGDHEGEPSEICFGGLNEARVQEAELTWAPVVLPDLGYWQVQIKDLRVGNRSLPFCEDGQCRAVVDTGTSLLAVPRNFATELSRELMPPELEALVGSDCSDSAMQSLQFILEDGTPITLKGEEYARSSMDPKKGLRSCRPALMPLELPEPLGPKLFIWGEPVLRKYYTVYHWEDKQIGFGLAKHTAAEPEESRTV